MFSDTETNEIRRIWLRGEGIGDCTRSWPGTMGYFLIHNYGQSTFKTLIEIFLPVLSLPQHRLTFLFLWETEGDAGPIRQRKTWSPRSAPYFVRNERPEGLPNTHRGQEIQQLLPEEPQGTPPYFVSLFDPERNIPFYSAYKVTPQQAPFIGKLHRKDAKGWWRNPPGNPFMSVF